MDIADGMLFAAAWFLRGASVVGAWLLTYAVHSTVLLLVAWWLVSRRSLRALPTAQHTIWSVALVAGWITSAAQVASPWRPLGGDVRLPTATRHEITRVQVVERTKGAWTPVAPRAAGELGDVRLMVLAVPRTSLVVLGWALVAAGLLAHLALARRRLLASLATRRDADATLAGNALRHVAALGGVSRPLTLTTSDVLRAPAAISQDEIVLPTRALQELTLAEQEGVLAHELAHVIRGDPRWLRVAMWIERIAWFQPLNRVARREMQLSAEFAADAWAVEVTRQPLRLAQALARVAEWVTPERPSPAQHAPGADGSPLVERVRRLTTPRFVLDGRGGRPAKSAIWLVAASVLAVLPRIATGAGRATEFQRMERIELRVSDNTLLDGRTARTGEVSFPARRVVRLVRMPRGPVAGVADDSVPGRGVVRRAVFITARTAS